MLFPYRDVNPTYRVPVVTLLILGSCIFIFIYGVTGSMGFEYMTRQYALIPWELFRGNLPNSALVPPLACTISYMFLHGDVSHLVFNMLFLWIFGNNVEDAMTRIRFPLFYILCGLISALAFVAIDPLGTVPLVGASGAISGVLGAYLFLFPMARVHAIVFIIPVRMPAIIFILAWFYFQISGCLTGGGNVAWISHVAGFISGILLHPLFLRR